MNSFFRPFCLASIALASIAAISCHSRTSKSDEPSTTLPLGEKVPLADPFILLHEDVYYAYGTLSGSGIVVFTSDDLKTWTPSTNLALDKVDSWGEKWFWAPEVYKVGERFIMYYSAEEHICAAVADSPLGPFRQEVRKPMLEGEKSIDNTLFIDDDGTPYVFFCRFNDGLNVWVAELEDDCLTIKTETLHPCIHTSQDWEKVWPRVNEGPFVIKRDGVYYMTYSANSYESQSYGIGCATATDLMGDWTKYEHNPLLQKPGDLVGTGHHCFFADKEGLLRVCFHAHKDTSNIHPREMYITTASFEREDGIIRLTISPDFEVPVLD